jgi:hypothetical protein
MPPPPEIDPTDDPVAKGSNLFSVRKCVNCHSSGDLGSFTGNRALCGDGDLVVNKLSTINTAMSVKVVGMLTDEEVAQL